ncbi:MAG: hypothetical protein RL172_398 [Bacteroidota bacterium]|jgi:hypothetical protein
MEDKFTQYFKLFWMILGSFVAFIAVGIIVFYLLKLFSITFFNIPGWDAVYQFVVTIFPYLFFFAGYYYLYNKVRQNNNGSMAIVAGKILMIAGSLACIASMVMAVLAWLKVKWAPVVFFDKHPHYAFIIQVITLFTAALVLATADPKEKNWMDRKQD